MNSTVDENAHLLYRLDPCSNQSAQTFENRGFFVWDPQQVHMPPGDSDITEHGGKLHDTIMGVGQIGFGFEASLESWYRFLVDSNPFDQIAVVDSSATASGTDNVLLAQRAGFFATRFNADGNQFEQ